MMNNSGIYLDHAAATPIDEKVLQSMKPYFSDFFFNPSSPYQPAILVRKEYEAAKQRLASQIGAKETELVMTAGATESINLAFSNISNHVIVSSVEHPAVLQASVRHERTIVPVDKNGMVSPSDIEASIRPDTELISLQLANNEIGTVQPIRDVAAIVKAEREKRLQGGNKIPIFLHCDGSQGVGQLDIHISRLGVDMLTLNCGKMYGPKHVGLLWVARDVKLAPQILGGGQESGQRSGTENVAGVVGFARALELAGQNKKSEIERLTKMRDGFETVISKKFPDAVFSGHAKHRLASFSHVSFPKIDGERMVFALEARGVFVATGSACAANKGTRSHVLEAIGLAPELADGSLRLTFGHLSTEENTQQATEIICEEIEKEYARMNQ